MRQLRYRAGQLDARRAAADDHEGEKGGAAFGIGLALGALQRQQNPAAYRRGVFESLEPGCIRLPFVVAEVGVARAGGENQAVEVHGGAVFEQYAARADVDPAHDREQRRHFLAPP